MTNKKYLRYSRNAILSTFIGTMTWVSLATFMLVAKNEIGIKNIPIFEVMVFVSSLISTRYVYDLAFKIKNTVLLNVTIETVFLIGLYYMLLNNTGLAAAGVAVYMVIISNAFTSPMMNESKRHFEDQSLTNHMYKRYIRKLRKKSHLMTTIGATIGSLIGLLFISYYKVDLKEFTMIMLILNVLQNLWDYYLWWKYLK